MVPLVRLKPDTTIRVTNRVRLSRKYSQITPGIYRSVNNPELSPSVSCFTPTLSSIVTSRFVIGV